MILFIWGNILIGVQAAKYQITHSNLQKSLLLYTDSLLFPM
jgi:hypothetical protein